MKCSNCSKEAFAHCARCMKAVFCSENCQKTAWKKYHFVSCRPFYFIEVDGKKRDEPEKSDEELEAIFLQMWKEKKPDEELRVVFRKMSPAYQKKYENMVPCVNEEDPSTLVSVDDIVEDNKIFMMENGHKYCFDLDELYKWINAARQTNPPREPNNPLTRHPFTNEQLAHVMEKIEIRKREELKRVYYQDYPEGSWANLINTYGYTLESFDWDLVPFSRMNRQYLAMVFQSYKSIRKLVFQNKAFNDFVHSDRNFWYWILKKLSPKERHEDDSEDLIAVGLKKIARVLKYYVYDDPVAKIYRLSDNESYYDAFVKATWDGDSADNPPNYAYYWIEIFINNRRVLKSAYDDNPELYSVGDSDFEVFRNKSSITLYLKKYIIEPNITFNIIIGEQRVSTPISFSWMRLINAIYAWFDESDEFDEFFKSVIWPDVNLLTDDFLDERKGRITERIRRQNNDVYNLIELSRKIIMRAFFQMMINLDAEDRMFSDVQKDQNNNIIGKGNWMIDVLIE